MQFDELEMAKMDINLKTLKLKNPKINEILVTIKHVVLYEFIENEWKKMDIEGTLFLCKSQPNEYQLIVLNRLSMLDFTMIINIDFKFELLGEYLMFQLNDKVVGLWIFGSNSLGLLSDSIQKCIETRDTRQEQTKLDQESPLTRNVTFNEIWDSLELMAIHTNNLLTEQEFLARLHILVQVR